MQRSVFSAPSTTVHLPSDSLLCLITAASTMLGVQNISCNDVTRTWRTNVAACIAAGTTGNCTRLGGSSRLRNRQQRQQRQRPRKTVAAFMRRPSFWSRCSSIAPTWPWRPPAGARSAATERKGEWCAFLCGGD
eukprot:2266727-Pleurochrysis_carterae.AAC.1